MGVVLMHEEHAIAYESHKLNDNERHHTLREGNDCPHLLLMHLTTLNTWKQVRNHDNVSTNHFNI